MCVYMVFYMVDRDAMLVFCFSIFLLTMDIDTSYIKMVSNI